MTDGDIYGIAGVPSAGNADLVLGFILKDVLIVRAYQQRFTLQNGAMFAVYYESHHIASHRFTINY